MRSTYWQFAKVWPDQAEAISAELDANSKKLLEKANPNSGGTSQQPRSKSGPSKLRQTIAAQKQAAAAAAAAVAQPSTNASVDIAAIIPGPVSGQILNEAKPTHQGLVTGAASTAPTKPKAPQAPVPSNA